MELLGHLLNKVKSFPEFRELMEYANEAQRQSGHVVAGLQLAFGTPFADFANQQGPPLKEGLFEVQKVASDELEVLQTLLQATSSMPADLKQIKDLHERVSKSRKALKNAGSAFEKADKSMRDALTEKEKLRGAPPGSKSLLTAHDVYQQACEKRQIAFGELETARNQNEEEEKEYHRLFIQVVLGALESYATANLRSAEGLNSVGQRFVETAERLQPAEDPSIRDLEEQLRILEEEAV